MFDAGEPGPSYMLGHAHCDALSYELSVGGEPAVANCGAYAYQTPLRPWFRSTAAHNTAVVGGEEQLECWAEHRVGRTYRLLGAAREGNAVEAAVRLPGGRVHRRRLELSAGELRVRDEADASVGVVSHVHLLRPDLVELVPGEGCSVAVSEVDFSPAFGVLSKVADYAVSGEGSASYSLLIRGRNS